MPVAHDRLPRRMRAVAAAAYAIAVVLHADAAFAQATGSTPAVPSALTGSSTRQVWQHLDPLAIGVVIVGVLILVLLVTRIAQVVKRERRPRRKRSAKTSKKTPKKAASRDDPLERPTNTGQNDWGFDQDKRAAGTRAPADAARAEAALMTSLDINAAQWSKSEVHHAAQASFEPGESMGKASSRTASPYRTGHNPFYVGESVAESAPIEVEEVADVLLQAELLVQLGDPKQAMTLLSQHIRDTKQPGPAIWLMLLNLYQTTGRKAQYEALARGFKTLFNAAVPPWAKSRETGVRDLESYPRVMMQLQTDWPKPAIRPFLEGLLNDDRGGSRQGFTLAAYREILFLIDVFGVLERMSSEEEERNTIQTKLGRMY